jgi:anaerobic ribonucleoside-triphosphate reductase activating protein
MIKYVNTEVVFQEIPDETTLAINLSGCPCHCPGCHSSYLWDDIGEPLTAEALEALIQANDGMVTCVSLMGGDADPDAVDRLALWLRNHHPDIKTAWYSGRIRLARGIDKNHFDYIKLGPYIRHLGALKDKTTNQRLYKRVAEDRFEDITYRFWNK